MRAALRGQFLFLLVWRGAPATGAPPEELGFIQQHGGMAPEPGDLHAAARVMSLVLRKQLGLRWEPAKVEVEFIVVGHIDRTPRQNK